MTTRSHRRISGSVSAALFAAAIAGCGGDPPPTSSTGTGGDVAPPPSPLCSSGSGSLSTGGGGATGVSMPTPGGAFFSPFQPQYGDMVSAPVAPPAISGGTLRILADGHTAVAADPDRDQVYIVDLGTRSVRTIVLNPGDEPGRVAVDAAGRAHVALRRGGAVVSIDTVTGEILQRRAVCAAPRGITYDSTGLLYVACAGGELVSLPADGGSVVRTVNLGNDLRDVVVEGSHLRVSRFSTAEVLTVENDGSVSSTVRMPAFRATSARGGQRYTPSTAWKMTEMPDNSGVMVLHQRGVDEEVQPVVGGYGGPDACNGIVHPTVSMVATDGSVRSGPALAGLVLAVDMAISQDAKRVAVISAGNATNTAPGDTQPDLTRVFVTDTDSVTDDHIGCMPDGTHGPCSTGFVGGKPVPFEDGSTGGTGAGGSSGTAPPNTMTGAGGATSVPPGTTCGVPDPSIPQTVGEPIAVAFDGSGQVVVQSREPAMLALPGTNNIIKLSDTLRKDTGHLIFHSNAGGFLACASCHAEGNDDGRVWNFTCQGARRTQSLQAGGLRGSEPFHWDGLETDMTRLMVDVFQGRMSGPTLAPEQIDGLMTWIDGQPRVPRAAPTDAAAVARGQALFNDASRAACATCHSGPSFSNNMTVDVGTGGAFQVPSLVGIGSRGPFMHDGCAKTLTERFTNTKCGGTNHGKISGLSDSERADLVTYLQSI